MPVGDLAPEIAVIVAAALGLVLAMVLPHHRQGWGAPLALAGLAVAAVLVALQIGRAELTFMGVWALDGASVWARLMILGATAFTVLLAPQWFRDDRRHGEYYPVLLLSAAGAMALAGSADLLQLVMGVLLSSVTGYTLAAYHRDWPISVEAGMKYFLVGALANALLVVGVTLMFGMLGSSGYGAMAAALHAGAASPLLLLGTALVVVGLAFKLGAVPAHTWVPDVAEGAPAPAAAFLTVVPKIGAAVALARLVGLFPLEAMGLRMLVAVLAVATMTLGNLAALWQDDVRRLIGWSSVSQAGYALMAVSVIGLSGQALPALLVFLLAYAAANLAAFAAVAHLRGRTAIADYDGLFATRPGAALTIAVSFLSLVGIPPLVGFIGKLELFVVVIEGGFAWLAVVAVANTVVSLFYYLRVVARMSFAAPAGGAAVLGPGTAAATWIGLAAVVGFGLAAEYGLAAMNAARILP